MAELASILDSITSLDELPGGFVPQVLVVTPVGEDEVLIDVPDLLELETHTSQKDTFLEALDETDGDIDPDALSPGELVKLGADPNAPEVGTTYFWTGRDPKTEPESYVLVTGRARVYESAEDTLQATFEAGGPLENEVLATGDMVSLIGGNAYAYDSGDQTLESSYIELGGTPAFSTGFTATETVGGLSAGTVFEEGDPLESAIIQMFFAYVDASVSFSYAGSNNVEVATTQNSNITGSYTKNDAGDVTDITIGGAIPAAPPDSPDPLPAGSFSFQRGISLTETIATNAAITLSLSYAEGQEQNGVSDPPGPKTVTDSVTLRWQYRYWWGVDQLAAGFDLSAGTPTSGEVRGLPSSELNLGSTIAQNGVDGATSLEIAVEDGKTVSELFVSAGGVISNTVDLTNVSTGSNTFSDGVLWYRLVDVTLPDSTTTKQYRVYQWVPNQPFPSDINVEWRF